MVTRRQVLAGAGGAGGAAAVGWLTLGGDDSTEYRAVEHEPIGRRPAVWPSFNNTRRNRGYAPGLAGPQGRPTTAWERPIEGCEASPAVVGGTILFPDRHRLRAFDRSDGTERWQTDVVVTAPPTVCFDSDEGPVIVVGAHHTPKVRAYTAAGAAAWQFEPPAGGDVVGAPVYSPGRGRLYVGTTTGRVLAIDPTSGQVDWQHEVFGDVRAGLSLGVEDGFERLLVPTLIDPSAGLVFTLDASDGERKGVVTIGDTTHCAPAVVGELSFILDVSGTLYAVEYPRSGIRWQSTLTDDDGWRYRGLASDGTTLYVTAEDGVVQAIDARSGDERWTYGLDGRASNEPNVVTDDTLYVPMEDGIVALATGDTGLLAGRKRWTWRSDRAPLSPAPRVLGAAGHLYFVEPDHLVALG